MSSSRYVQSNSKVENSIKTAKKLMMKVRDDKSDAYFVFLYWHNMPSEQLVPLLVQIMCSHCLHSRLPICNKRLIKPQENELQSALQQAKLKQAVYYKVV